MRKIFLVISLFLFLTLKTAAPAEAGCTDNPRCDCAALVIQTTPCAAGVCYNWQGVNGLGQTMYNCAPYKATPCDPGLCNCGARSIKPTCNPMTECDLGPASVGGVAARTCAPALATPTVTPPPSFWITRVFPMIGFGPDPALGINFFKQKLIPFLVSAALFFIMVLSLIFTIIGGIMWMTGGGNKEALAKAKNTVTYALIGLALGLGSFIILSVIGKFFANSQLLSP
jgi:hypothetical protein